MKRLTVCFLIAFLWITHVYSQGTAFTYQGRLSNEGLPATGAYDFTFTLYDASSGGNTVAGTITNSATTVSNGVFTTILDFGTGVFTGNQYWLEIAVVTNGATSYSTLSPRQAITPTPYAMFAPTAGTAAVAASAASVQASNIVGSLTGNGSGLTNLNGAQLTGTISDVVLSTNVLAVKGYATCAVNRYTNAGVYSVTVPQGVSQMVAKLWGAGGARSLNTPNGGGGGYVQRTLAVTPGQVFTVVVGQRGSAGGGPGSGNAAGGGGANGKGGNGGQGSSLFYFTGSSYVLKALAGAGGGGADFNGDSTGGPGGNSPTPIGNGTTSGYDGIGGAAASGSGPGQNYATNATTTGIASLNLVGGNGGGGSILGGGGGGGYGGGGGGGYLNFGNSGGGGGGSYGDVIIAGDRSTPGNTNDFYYTYPAGFGGTVNPDCDGAVVLLFQLPSVNTPAFVQATRVGAVFLSGDGSGVTNVNAASGNGTFTGAFTGNASGLTNVNASSGNGSFSGTFTGNHSGSLTGTVAGSVSGTITGNGAGLTNLNAANLSSGIANDSILSANIPRLNANANFNGTVGATNFVGNGAGLTNVPWVIKWNVVSGTSQTVVGNNGYLLTNNTAQVVVTLPASPNIGEIVRIAGTGSPGWRLAQNAGQSILAGQIGGQFGVVWIPSVNSGSWQSIACSADGTRLIGVVKMNSTCQRTVVITGFSKTLYPGISRQQPLRLTAHVL